MRSVTNDCFYPVSPEALWQVVTDFDALAYVCKPYLTFEGLPKGQLYEGQKITVQVSLFGKLPAQDYHMEVVACDPAAMTFESAEVGAGVKSWRHKLWLVRSDSGTHLHEEITIEAGILTPLFALWARKLYRNRNPRRGQWLRGQRA